MNFFAQTLSFEENCFVFPPVGRAIDAVKHIAKFKSKGVLVIPAWPRSPWFSCFFPDGKHCAAWVKTLIILNPVFVSGIGVGQVFKGLKQFDTAALEFDFQSFSLSLCSGPFSLFEIRLF